MKRGEVVGISGIGTFALKDSKQNLVKKEDLPNIEGSVHPWFLPTLELTKIMTRHWVNRKDQLKRPRHAKYLDSRKNKNKKFKVTGFGIKKYVRSKNNECT